MSDKKEGQNRKIWVVSALGLGVVLAAQLAATIFLTGRGDELSNLERQVLELEMENRRLRQELAEKASLSKIASVSAELGLQKPESFVYLNLIEPVAAVTLP